MIRASVHEEAEDKICHFYSVLHTKIQDIVNYKEYNIVIHLFQLAMLAKKKRITGSPTDENEDLLHASSNIYDPIQNCYAFWSSFHDDHFSFRSSLYVIDTFCNSTPRYGPE
jgi:hypothetical protein